MSAYPAGGPAVAAPVPLYPVYEQGANPPKIVGSMPATFDPFSGPLGSPFDAMEYPKLTYTPGYATRVLKTDDHSTGGLSTGIGFALNDSGDAVTGAIGIASPLYDRTKPASVNGFTDDYQPGLNYNQTVLPPTAPVTALVAAPDARFLVIGGGKMVMTKPVGASPTDYSLARADPLPYVAQPLLAMGNGASRDAGAANPRTGFGMKLVTAPGSIAQGVAIEAGWINRTTWLGSGIPLPAGANAFGSSTTASPAVT